MRRRVYVSTVAALLAGCSERGGEGDETATDSETPTETAATSTATETSTAQATEADTPTDTPTPEDPLVRFEAALTEAHDRYVPEGTSFQDVNGSHTGVSKSDVMEPLERAETLKETIASTEPTGDRKEQFDKLTGVFWFLWWVTESHGHFVTAWQHHRTAWDQMLTDAGGAANSLSAVDTEIEGARAALNNLTRDSNPSDVSAFPPLIVSDYSAKSDRLSSEIEAFRSMTDALDSFRQALRKTDRAMVKYDRDNFTAAAVDFNDAASSFDDLVGTFRPGAWPDTFDTTIAEAACVADAMGSGCDRMNRIAESAADGNESNPQAAKGTARDEFESCDLVAQKVAVVEEFYS